MKISILEGKGVFWAREGREDEGMCTTIDIGFWRKGLRGFEVRRTSYHYSEFATHQDLVLIYTAEKVSESIGCFAAHLAFVD